MLKQTPPRVTYANVVVQGEKERRVPVSAGSSYRRGAVPLEASRRVSAPDDERALAYRRRRFRISRIARAA
jgi:hypothetical protein